MAPSTINRRQRRALKRTKVPPVTVPSDDLEIEAGGETYRPHAGESVTVKGGNRLSDVLISLKLADFAAVDDLKIEQVGDFVKSLHEIVDQVLDRIESWTWTDPGGEPYGPPTREILLSLDFKELGYLATVGMETPRSPEAQKNA